DLDPDPWQRECILLWPVREQRPWSQHCDLQGDSARLPKQPIELSDNFLYQVYRYDLARLRPADSAGYSGCLWQPVQKGLVQLRPGPRRVAPGPVDYDL